MYISDKCEWTPYTYDFALDEELDQLLKYIDSREWQEKLKDWLKEHKNYGLDEVFRKYQHADSERIKYYIIEQGYGLDILINDEDVYVRAKIAEQGYGLDILVNDGNYFVRAAVAKQGYGLDILVNDKFFAVRRVVAEQGYGLDILVNDENYEVRKAVAKQGYGLDKLINDEDKYVRAAVAGQGYGLDILINDEHSSVRQEVVGQDYGLDKLINDSKADVREYVVERLKNYKQSLITWYTTNQDKVYYESFHDILNDYVSSECIDVLINDNYYLDYLLRNTDKKSAIRKKIIELGYNNLQDWMTNYPDRVYYTEALKDLSVKKTTKSKKDKTTEKANATDTSQISEAEKVTQDFIYKINDSKTLAVDKDSVEEFFSSEIDESKNNILVIHTVDTKIPLIKVNKTVKDDKIIYIFNVDITADDDSNFAFKTSITTKDQLCTLINQTIDALNNYPQFAKYTDDLSNCIS